jgi:ribonuclease HI
MTDYLAYIDGACSPNPGGYAGFGVLVKAGGIPLWRSWRAIGFGRGMSNNVAEYAALTELLGWWRNQRKPSDRLYVCSDSKLLVRQMKGSWRVKSGAYIPYYKQAKRLITPDVSLRLIPREENEADILAKKALALVQ